MSAKVQAGTKKSVQKELFRGLARLHAKAINPGGSKGAVRGGKPDCQKRYSYEFKRRAVQLHLEEGITGQVISRELGVSDEAIYRWVKLYRQYGEQGLKEGAARKSGGAKLPAAVHELSLIHISEPTRPY